MKIKPGKIIRIYHDPITRKNCEGVAALVSQYRPDTGDGLSMWRVRFPGNPGDTYLRTIYNPDK